MGLAILIKKFSFTALLGIVAGSAFSVLACADEPEAEPPKAIIGRACQQCHDLGVLSQSPHSSAEWRVIVARMRANGADLSDAEAKQVEEYLEKAYATPP